MARVIEQINGRNSMKPIFVGDVHEEKGNAYSALQNESNKNMYTNESAEWSAPYMSPEVKKKLAKLQ